MNNNHISSPRSAVARVTLVAFGCALLLAPALKATDATTMQPLAAEKAAALPVTTAFEKGPAGEKGPYVLKVTNTSKDALKVTVKVLLSVAFHADNKARNLPEQSIAAGGSISVPDLAAADKVIITAAGFAPLELTVP
jgi:hypothetical protein